MYKIAHLNPIYSYSPSHCVAWRSPGTCDSPIKYNCISGSLNYCHPSEHKIEEQLGRSRQRSAHARLARMIENCLWVPELRGQHSVRWQWTAAYSRFSIPNFAIQRLQQRKVITLFCCSFSRWNTICSIMILITRNSFCMHCQISGRCKQTSAQPKCIVVWPHFHAQTLA